MRASRRDHSYQDRYHAFISYSHTTDASIARRIRRDLIAIGSWSRPRPAHRIFQYAANGPAVLELWELLDSLDRSDFLIVLTRYDGPTRPGVEKEIEHWLSTRPDGLRRMAVVLVEGAKQEGRLPQSLAALTGIIESPDDVLLLEAAQYRRSSRFRRFGFGGIHDDEWLMLIGRLAAAMLSVDADETLQESARRRRLRTILAIALVSVTLLTLAYGALSKRRGNQLLAESVANQIERNDGNGSFPNLDLRNFELRSADLRNTDFHGSSFANLVLDDVNAESSRWTETDIDGALVEASGFVDADFSCRDIERVEICQGASISNALFQSSVLRLADFNFAELNHVTFEKSDLRDSTWIGAIGAHLTLIDIDLRGADFGGARFDDLSIDDVCFDERTVWPVDVDEPTENRGASCR